MKKTLAILMALLLAFSLAACSGGGGLANPTEPDKPGPDTSKKEALNVALLLGQQLGSHSFDDVLFAGVEKACKELNVHYSVIQAVEASAVVDTARAAIANGANTLIFSVAWTKEAATLCDEFPNRHFALLDSDGTGSVASAYDNAYEVSYREQEAAFLNAAFCALMSKTGKIAQIQGVDTGPLVRFNAGFRAGSLYVNGVDAATAVVGFMDPNKGYETAMMYYSQGYDWIACCAGGSNLGVFQASKEKGGDSYCCGAADGQFHLMPDRIVCSQVKTIDIVAYDFLLDANKGNFRGGKWDVFGRAEGGVDLIFNDQNPELLKIIPEDVMNAYKDILNKVVSGEIKIPANAEELEKFTARYKAA